MQCVPPEPIKGQCTAELRVDRTRTKLDILFVVDTSASLRRGGTGTLEDGELVQIGRGMKHFVKNLDPQTDYRIGVMLGHGPATSYHGKLFQAGKGDPAVVDYKALAKKGMSRAQIEEQLGQIMERKMRQVPNESGGAQGEAMMLSLYNAIRTPSLLGRIKKQGLFRDDAALAVVFVTDEQDVCFDYSGTEYQPTLKTIKNSKGVTETIPDPYETRFFNSVCAKAVKGKPLTPGHVYDALMSLKQDKSKLMVNAIVYTTPVPESLRNRVEDENEMGHGIIDLVQLAGNGQMADLANVYLRNSEFATELDALGKYAHFKMKYNHVYRCDQKNIHPDAINYTSMQVNILDPQGRIVGTFSGACGGNTACPEGVMGPIQFRSMVDTRGRHTPYAEVSVDPNALETLLKAHGLEEGKVQMSFWTRSDINPETGAPWEAKDMKPVSQTQPPAVLPPQSAPET